MKRWLACSALVSSCGHHQPRTRRGVCSGDDKIIRGTVAHNLMYGAINTNSSVFMPPRSSSNTCYLSCP
ncbi:MAG: hypothetical protein R3B07_21740 [Polyangiaceae bacterium]